MAKKLKRFAVIRTHDGGTVRYIDAERMTLNKNRDFYVFQIGAEVIAFVPSFSQMVQKETV